MSGVLRFCGSHYMTGHQRTHLTRQDFWPGGIPDTSKRHGFSCHGSPEFSSMASVQAVPVTFSITFKHCCTTKLPCPQVWNVYSVYNSYTGNPPPSFSSLCASRSHWLLLSGYLGSVGNTPVSVFCLWSFYPHPSSANLRVPSHCRFVTDMRLWSGGSLSPTGTWKSGLKLLSVKQAWQKQPFSCSGDTVCVLHGV